MGNEFCERLSYYGMKAILGIYLHKKLHLTEDKSTVIYHTFAMLCYFTPIFGAMIADQLLGRFKTIVYISMIYVLGHLLKTLAAIPTLGVPPLWVIFHFLRNHNHIQGVSKKSTDFAEAKNDNITILGWKLEKLLTKI